MSRGEQDLIEDLKLARKVSNFRSYALVFKNHISQVLKDSVFLPLKEEI